MYHEMLVEVKNFSTTTLLFSTIKSEIATKPVLTNATTSILVAVGFNNLADFLKSARRLKGAEILLKEALRILRVCASESPYDEVRLEGFLLMMKVYHNLGSLYELQGDSDKAFECFSKGLFLLRRLGANQNVMAYRSVSQVCGRA